MSERYMRRVRATYESFKVPPPADVAARASLADLIEDAMSRVLISRELSLVEGGDDA